MAVVEVTNGAQFRSRVLGTKWKFTADMVRHCGANVSAY